MSRFALRSAILVAGLVQASVPSALAGNPLLPHVFAADPSAHVWPNDERLWLYTSHDEPGTNTHATMSSYHVFSTHDLVSWTDHGRVFHREDSPWAASHMWAIDAVYRHGKYYLVYCAQEQAGQGMFRTGIAVSDRPEGPFTDQGPIQGVDWGQDPALFIDEDDTPYLFWGAGGGCSAVKLSDDLMSALPDSRVDLTKQLPHVFEGPWVNRVRGRYYLSYPGLVDGQWPEKMFWAVADRPLGPYSFGGQFMDSHDGFAGTNHGSIVEFDGKWIFFYHSAWLSKGKSEVRNLMADYLEFSEDGRILPIKPTEQGVAARGVQPGPSHVTIRLEAETADRQGGALEGVVVSNHVPGFSGRGYVDGFGGNYDRVEFLAQLAQDSEWSIVARYSTPTESKYTLLVGAIEKSVTLPASQGFSETRLGNFNFQAGDNRVVFSRFPRRDGTGVLLDALLLEPASK